MQPIKTLLTPTFSIESAVQYLNYTVAERTKPESERYRPSQRGVIVGVLTMNDEVELIIKFMEGVRQYTLSEVRASLEVIDD
ncbi:hypothetical protein BGP77_16610 [Saccharospirillum sp. MSK14-1]|uniref:hypothetical protein n=1 Tax=Saccharospirillum sp. MSK14-1 TaxID=1897632 RepID=UPI000D361B2B|nr:hypothetical protein [Saccharospirillum sp. MSK14-1]PTY38073.1 hypothetical protein BGP77_16610 [Saccharospirillum sp. MSK14-1]